MSTADCALPDTDETIMSMGILDFEGYFSGLGQRMHTTFAWRNDVLRLADPEVEATLHKLFQTTSRLVEQILFLFSNKSSIKNADEFLECVHQKVGWSGLENVSDYAKTWRAKHYELIHMHVPLTPPYTPENRWLYMCYTYFELERQVLAKAAAAEQAPCPKSCAGEPAPKEHLQTLADEVEPPRKIDFISASDTRADLDIIEHVSCVLDSINIDLAYDDDVTQSFECVVPYTLYGYSVDESTGEERFSARLNIEENIRALYTIRVATDDASSAILREIQAALYDYCAKMVWFRKLVAVIDAPGLSRSVDPESTKRVMLVSVFSELESLLASNSKLLRLIDGFEQAPVIRDENAALALSAATLYNWFLAAMYTELDFVLDSEAREGMAFTYVGHEKQNRRMRSGQTEANTNYIVGHAVLDSCGNSAATTKRIRNLEKYEHLVKSHAHSICPTGSFVMQYVYTIRRDATRRKPLLVWYGTYEMPVKCCSTDAPVEVPDTAAGLVFWTGFSQIFSEREWNEISRANAKSSRILVCLPDNLAQVVVLHPALAEVARNSSIPVYLLNYEGSDWAKNAYATCVNTTGLSYPSVATLYLGPDAISKHTGLHLSMGELKEMVRKTATQ